MKKGWEIKRFSDVVEIKNGRNQRLVADENGAYPIYGSGGIMGYASEYICGAGATVIGRKGSINRPIYVGTRFWNVDTAFGLCSKEDLNEKFLHYFCLGYDFSGHNRGTTIPSLVKADLLKIPIPIPPLAEQQRIVAVLDAAFAAIATAKAHAEKNLQNARALFDSHLNAVFSQRGDNSKVRIGDVAGVYDGPHATPKTVDSGPIFLGISALQDGKINLGETRHVTPEDFAQWTRRVRPAADDVVFSYETRLGQAAIIPQGLECCLGRRMGLVRLNLEKVDPHFFVYQYISPPFRSFLSSKTILGATVDRISILDFPSFEISLPPLHVQQELVKRIIQIDDDTQHLKSIYRRKLSALDALKQSLLHQAFTGQLTATRREQAG